MRTVAVVSKEEDWPLRLTGVDVVLAQDYLTDPAWIAERGARVYNLCRSYRYQSAGYYVSLLATARRHRPFPGLMTILDMKSRALVRTVDEELDERIQKSLGDIKSDRFELSVYFGRNLAKRHDALARRIFSQFPSPLMRAHFVRGRVRGRRWRLSSVTPIALREVPASHWDFLEEAAEEYFARPRYRGRSSRSTRYDLAILHDPEEELAPSDSRALGRFRTAGQALGLGVEMVQREDYGRIAEFDALFLRETTYVDHHTFRFSQRAESEGLVVIDDPNSILRCTNKVFMTEAFAQRGVPQPETWITDQVEASEVGRRIGYPCVVKWPDSSFSQGVVKCADAAAFEACAAKVLEESDLLLVQEFLPSDYDWRVGIIDGEVLYACRYHMAQGHWQIVQKAGEGEYRYGRVEPVPLDEVAPRVLKTALKAAGCIGDGLYGVDLKQVGRRLVVTEVNDNPNLDAGCEDALLGKQLYERIMGTFLKRIEARKRGDGR